MHLRPPAPLTFLLAVLAASSAWAAGGGAAARGAAPLATGSALPTGKGGMGPATSAPGSAAPLAPTTPTGEANPTNASRSGNTPTANQELQIGPGSGSGLGPSATREASSAGKSGTETGSTPDDSPIAYEHHAERNFVLEVTPLAIFVGHWGLGAEFLLANHHALVGSAYYLFNRTDPQPQNVFRGVGGELGYRYFTGGQGPRGFFAGPSFLLAYVDSVTDGLTGPITSDPMTMALIAAPSTHYHTNFLSMGLAVDAGYQAIVADTVTIGLGAGIQYSFANSTIPDQQIPVAIHTNRGLWPRLHFSLGWAFDI